MDALLERLADIGAAQVYDILKLASLLHWLIVLR